MNFIAENIHIISKNVKEAIKNQDDDFILNLVKNCSKFTNYLDLNVGFIKNEFKNSLIYLVNLIQNYDKNIKFSLDSTNTDEIENAIKIINDKENCFINSANGDFEKADRLSKIASFNNSNLICLTMTKDGIPKTADERLEIAYSILDIVTNNGVSEDKIYFDPLVLPLQIKQEQAKNTLDTIRMIKESMPNVKTLIGLSNISNGAITSNRAIINRVFYVMARASGLDFAIVDGLDFELNRISEVLNNKKPETEKDKLYLDLYDCILNFARIEDINYNKDDIHERNIYKTAKILLNKEIYMPSFLERQQI